MIMKEQSLCLLDSKKDNDVNEPHPIPRRLCVYNWDTFVSASESESCVRSCVNFVCASAAPSDNDRNDCNDYDDLCPHCDVTVTGVMGIGLG